jgi:DNA polymerase-3 subunit gamma/tau
LWSESRKKKNILGLVDFELADELTILQLKDKKEVDSQQYKSQVEPAAKPEAKPKTPTVPRVAPKSISIKNIISGNADPAANEEKDSECDSNSDNSISCDDVNPERNEIDENLNNFSQDDLNKVWQNFITSNLADKPRYATLLNNYMPSLTDELVIQVQLETALQQELFKEIKHDLLFYLRKNLGNSIVTINEMVVEQDNSKNKLYTVDDKFRYLSEKNPVLIKLKQQLNLDFD